MDTILLDAILWFALRGENGASTLMPIRAAYESVCGQDRAAGEILAAAGTKPVERGGPSALVLASYFAPASDVRGQPRRRLERDLLLVCDVAQSGARPLLLEPLVVEELANGWSRVISDETFALQMPLSSGPEIEAAIKEMRSSGLRGAARLILVAAPATQYPLDEKWLKFLQMIIEERKSIDQPP